MQKAGLNNLNLLFVNKCPVVQKNTDFDLFISLLNALYLLTNYNNYG
nr:hypothetical protein [Mucilaginibacter sp. SP1R1]